MLDVGKDERHELHGEVAKAGVSARHLAAIRAATRGWVLTTAPVVVTESFLGRGDRDQNDERRVEVRKLFVRKPGGTCTSELVRELLEIRNTRLNAKLARITKYRTGIMCGIHLPRFVRANRRRSLLKKNPGEQSSLTRQRIQKNLRRVRVDS